MSNQKRWMVLYSLTFGLLGLVCFYVLADGEPSPPPGNLPAKLTNAPATKAAKPADVAAKPQAAPAPAAVKAAEQAPAPAAAAVTPPLKPAAAEKTAAPAAPAAAAVKVVEKKPAAETAQPAAAPAAPAAAAVKAVEKKPAAAAVKPPVKPAVAEKPAAPAAPAAAAVKVVEKKPAAETAKPAAAPAAAAAGLAGVAAILEASAAETEDIPELSADMDMPLREDVGAVPAGAVRQAGKRDLWRVGAGMLWRSIKTRSWHSGSYSKDYPISGKADESSGGNRDGQYKDGYVQPDAWTGLDGGTWNWGYDSPSQVDGNTLKLTSQGRVVTDFHRDLAISEGSYSDSGENEPGIYLVAQRKIFQEPRWDCRLHLDFMRISSSIGGNAANFRDEQRWETREEFGEDLYSIAGTGFTADSPPYQGDYSSTGPCIPMTPLRSGTTGSRSLDEGSYLAYNAIKHDLDLQLLTFSMGMSLNYHFRRLRLGGATGPTLNLAETDATYQETLYESWNGGPASVLKEWRDSEDDTDTLFGYFVQAEAGLRITSWIELGVFGRYDWLENITCDIGQSRYVVNPEGGSLGGSLSLVF